MWSVCGHQKIIRALQKSIESDKIAHAYLFSGPKEVGKRQVALNFIKALQCQNQTERPCGKCQNCLQIEKNIHPDTIIFQPDSENREIKISQMQEIKKKMNLKQYQATYKILLLDGAENLNEEAANSLLKFLEEPLGRVVIILICADIQAMLPTIVSRCVVINFLPVSRKEMMRYFANVKNEKYNINNQKVKLEELIIYSGGRPGRVISWLENPEEFLRIKEMIKDFVKVVLKGEVVEKFRFISQFYNKKEESIKFLTNLILFYQHLLLWRIGCEDLEEDKEIVEFAKNSTMEKIKKMMLDSIKTKNFISQNINLKLALENMMLNTDVN